MVASPESTDADRVIAGNTAGQSRRSSGRSSLSLVRPGIRASMDQSPKGGWRGNKEPEIKVDHSTPPPPGQKAKLVQMMDKHNVMGKVKLAASFKTLRDMKGDIIIPEEKLEKVRQLGQGAFGSVDLCNYVVDGKVSLVAVKRIKPELLSSKHDMDLFLKECELLKKISHKNIVDFIGMGEIPAKDKSSGQIPKISTFLVQEFCNSGSLQKVIEQQMSKGTPVLKAYTTTQVLEWMIDVAQGIKYLHGASPQILHRDLKLENVLLNKPTDGGRMQAKLADFGLSTIVSKKMALRRETFIKLKRDGLKSPSSFKLLRSSSSKSNSGESFGIPDSKRDMLKNFRTDKKLKVLSEQNADQEHEEPPSPNNVAAAKASMKALSPNSLMMNKIKGRRSARSSLEDADDKSPTKDENAAVSPDSIEAAFADTGFTPARERAATGDGALAPQTVDGHPRSRAATGTGTDSGDATRRRRSSLFGDANPQNSPNSLARQRFRKALVSSLSFRMPVQKPVSKKFNLTGQTGSLMYMAPEMVKGEAYNEKIDIFSLSIMMYEMLYGYTVLCMVCHAGSPHELQAHADRTAAGVRLPLPAVWPSEVRATISKMWEQDPDDRPTAAETVKMLQELRPVMEDWDAMNSSTSCCGGGRKK